MARPKVTYNTQRIREDAHSKGWNDSALARESGLNIGTISRFLSGERQTATTAKHIARAFGRSPSRYIIRAEDMKVAS